MTNNLMLELIHNAAMLMALSVVYEINYVIRRRFPKFVPILNGVLIGFIGIVIMSIPYPLDSGLIFDTRSVLISVSALTFGAIPTLLAAVITIIYRFYIGGIGTLTGISVICLSALTGLVWRRILKKHTKFQLLKIYSMGIVVHILMLACMFFMPFETALRTTQQIAFPVMIVYPIGTVLLSLLLIWQRERNENMLKLAEAEGRYRSIFENNYAAMLLINPKNGEIIDANPAACSFYGWSLSEMNRKTTYEINTLPQEKINQEMQRCLNQERNHFLFKHRRAFGEPVDVEVYCGPIQFKQNTFLFSIIHDISERVATQQSLHESEKRFKNLVESAPEAIFISVRGKIIYCNKMAAAMLDYPSQDDLLNLHILDITHPDHVQQVRESLDRFKKNKIDITAQERVFRKSDGSPVNVLITVIPISYNLDEGVIIFAHDITNRKQLEKEKYEAESKLRQKQKLEAIGTLAGGVAHEINNPLTGIMNYAQLILDTADSNSEQMGFCLEIIRETERISGIVRNLLQFSRQEKQSHSYANIYDIVNQTTSLVNTIIKKDQITFSVEMEENLPDIKCRSQQIQQVIMNLLTNGRDALNEKYPGHDENKIMILRCSSFELEGNRWIRLIVEDHGNGIPEAYHEKIFEPFFSSKPKDLGTGLGLSISFGIVTDHHGIIRFETDESAYTRFILELPVDNGWDSVNHLD